MAALSAEKTAEWMVETMAARMVDKKVASWAG